MIPEIIKLTARNLRNKSTKSEVTLWNYLKWRQLWYRFNRQSPLYVFTENSGLDRYIIPDFYCKERKLIIEIDWSVHSDKHVYSLDREKEKLVWQKWINILRITNEEIHNDVNSVIIRIVNMLD